MTLSVSTEANTTTPKKLPLCLNTPNCVSSQADSTDKQHYIAPFKISGSAFAAWDALIKAINNHARMVITHQTADTLHAEATSLVLHFVDDINAVLDSKGNLIHIRSASRTGHSDFGVNRKRIEELRLQLQKAHLIE
ncbi:MAG: DUF1499 domain-containing protein [Methylovulum sp.]|nr:DUF1499 domain-containing protein [Methylovulum sp.]